MPTSDQNTRSRQCRSTLFNLSRHRCYIIFLTVLLNISGEKYSLALRLVEINTDPDLDAGFGCRFGFGKIMPIGPGPDQHNG
jgi:hypothetical protein